MTEIKNKRWRIRVAQAYATDGSAVPAIEFETLQCEFEIKKTLRPEPNCCKLKIYNLGPEHRAALEAMNLYDPKKVRGQKSAKKPAAKKKQGPRAPKVGRIRVEIEAGYETTGMSLLFRGDLRRAISTHDGKTWTTSIEGEDGGRSVLSSRITESFPPGTSRETVVRALASALGVGLGNIRDVVDQLSQSYAHGTVCTGQAAEELRGVLRSSGITYSIQNGVLQFLPAGQGLLRSAVVLSPTTGLVGSPHLDSSGTVIATALLVPDIAPGQYVVLECRRHSGQYKIVSVTHKCTTFGDDWYHVLELTPG